MTTPLVSVIMPVYNAEKWVRASVTSALGQSWKALELIIVDDGSTDGSAAIAEQFVGERVTLLRQSNRGASIARNAGLAVAQGAFIQYLDADDLMDSRKIELQVAALARAPGNVATSAWGRFEEGSGSIALSPSALWADLRPVDFLVGAYRNNLFMPNHAWLTPRVIADSVGGWSPRHARNDDAEYFARVVLASTVVTFVEDARVYYRSGHAGLSAALDRSSLEGYLWTLEEISRHLLAVEDSRRTREALAVPFDHFIIRAGDAAPDLAERAERELRALVGSRFEPPYARMSMRVLTWLVGRDRARLLRGRYRSHADRKPPAKESAASSESN